MARDKLLDANIKFLLGLGVVPIVIGIAIGIWPVALAGLGPWLLAWLDTNQRRRERKGKDKMSFEEREERVVHPVSSHGGVTWLKNG